MAVNASPISRIRFAVLLIAIIAVESILIAMLAVLLSAASSADDKTRRLLVHLSIACFAAVAITAVLLVLAVSRAIAQRLQGERHPPTEYVDAWSLAGKRIKTPPDDPETPPEDGPVEQS